MASKELKWASWNNQFLVDVCGSLTSVERQHSIPQEDMQYRNGNTGTLNGNATFMQLRTVKVSFGPSLQCKQEIMYSVPL